MSDSSESVSDTPFDSQMAANETFETLIPAKSSSIYELTYKKFMEWTLAHNINTITENVVTAYLKTLSTKFKPSTLWSTYSMLKTMINIKNNIDISTFSKLKSFLKLQSNGYKSKKSKILTSGQIKKFLLEAPDKEFLFTKVVLIFGISGGCRRQELKNLKINHIRDLENKLKVKLVATKTKTDRSFIIPGMFYEVSKKYMELRPPDMEQFFVNYQKGKCFKQVVGINKIGNQAKIIAEFLKLPNPELFTGHCFRRSGATILANAGRNTWSKQEKIGNAIVQSVQDIRTKIISSTSEEHIPPNTVASTSNFNNTSSNEHFTPIQIKTESLDILNENEEEIMLETSDIKSENITTFEVNYNNTPIQIKTESLDILNKNEEEFMPEISDIRSENITTFEVNYDNNSSVEDPELKIKTEPIDPLSNSISFSELVKQTPVVDNSISQTKLQFKKIIVESCESKQFSDKHLNDFNSPCTNLNDDSPKSFANFGKSIAEQLEILPLKHAFILAEKMKQLITEEKKKLMI